MPSKMLRHIACAGALALSAPAVAQTTASHLLNDEAVLIVADEDVVMQLDGEGHLSGLSATPAKGGDQTVPNGVVGFRLSLTAGGTVLVVQNHTGKAFDYEAALLEKAEFPARGRPTNVCTVLAGLQGFENWPGVAAPAMLLGAFRPGDTRNVTCPPPTDALRAAVTKK